MASHLPLLARERATPRLLSFGAQSLYFCVLVGCKGDTRSLTTNPYRILRATRSEAIPKRSRVHPPKLLCKAPTSANEKRGTPIVFSLRSDYPAMIPVAAVAEHKP